MPHSAALAAEARIFIGIVLPINSEDKICPVSVTVVYILI